MRKHLTQTQEERSNTAAQAIPAETMKVVIDRAGSYDRLRLKKEKTRQPGPGEVLINVKATGVNYADVIVRMSLYASAKELVGWPICPGFEVAGTVGTFGRSRRLGHPGPFVGRDIYPCYEAS